MVETGEYMSLEKNNNREISLHKNRVAAALGFDPNRDDAPKVLASGKGNIAQKIIEIATENELPIYKDEKLAHQLQNLQIGESIPTELYHIVAEILVFIGGIDKNYSKH